jgi:hypothetical protein
VREVSEETGFKVEPVALIGTFSGPEDKDLLCKSLAIVGTALVWLPLLAPFILLVPRLATGRPLLFDYLIPGELSPVAVIGGGLLLWAAFRARMRRGIIGGGLGAAVALLVGSQALAVVTGLASGEIEPAGWPLAMVLTLFGGYGLALVVTGIGGVLLVRGLFKVADPLVK